MTNVSLCERITRGNAVHKMQHTLHLVIVREPVTRDAVPDLDERRLRRTAPHRTSAHRSERRGLPTGGTVCTVHARMAFVGMSLLSFSRAFRSVLLPAPCTVRMLPRAHTDTWAGHRSINTSHADGRRCLLTLWACRCLLRMVAHTVLRCKRCAIRW